MKKLESYVSGIGKQTKCSANWGWKEGSSHILILSFDGNCEIKRAFFVIATSNNQFKKCLIVRSQNCCNCNSNL